MAGGSASDLRAPYPKGAQSLLCLEFGPFDVPDAAQTDEIVDKLTVPFAFKAVFAEVTALKVTDANASFSINIQDDTGTPKELITNFVVTATALGVGLLDVINGLDSEVDATETIYAGAILALSYTSGASDVALSVKVRLWVRPVN